MNNKRLLNHIPNKTAIRGFSILEFLVASLLSMIVLMAVSSTYFTARGLNKSANARIGIQQDLRNTANMIVRDAPIWQAISAASIWRIFLPLQ